MDNFNLRKYLAENKLLKENLELDGKEVDEGSIVIDGIDKSAGMDDGTSEAYIEQARFMDGTELTDDQITKLGEENPYLASEIAQEEWGQW